VIHVEYISPVYHLQPRNFPFLSRALLKRTQQLEFFRRVRFFEVRTKKRTPFSLPANRDPIHSYPEPGSWNCYAAVKTALRISGKVYPLHYIHARVRYAGNGNRGQLRGAFTWSDLKKGGCSDIPKPCDRSYFHFLHTFLPISTEKHQQKCRAVLFSRCFQKRDYSGSGAAPPISPIPPMEENRVTKITMIIANAAER
jgi:hypothetical protein